MSAADSISVPSECLSAGDCSGTGRAARRTYDARSSDRTGPQRTQRSGVRGTRATKVPVDATVPTKRIETVASQGRWAASPDAVSAERMRLMKMVWAKKMPPVSPAR
jgi:hypothetical protein